MLSLLSNIDECFDQKKKLNGLAFYKKKFKGIGYPFAPQTPLPPPPPPRRAIIPAAPRLAAFTSLLHAPAPI